MSTETRAHLKKYVTGLGIIALIVAAGGYLVLSQLLKSPVATIFPFITIFVATVTLGIHIILLKKVSGKPNLFVNSFMLGNTAKLFVYLLFMVAYALAFKDQAVAFVISFFGLYIIFTVYDITASNNFFRKN